MGDVRPGVVSVFDGEQGRQPGSSRSVTTVESHVNIIPSRQKSASFMEMLLKKNSSA